MRVTLGAAITAATVAALAAEYLRARRAALPAHGWLGLAALAGVNYLGFRSAEPVATYLTPLAWTAYILLADAMVFSLRGRSRLGTAPGEFARMALLSIPLWLVFEAYNLRLQNWSYVGLPEDLAARWLGYGWSFATITPAVFVTADLIRSFGWWHRPSRPLVIFPRAQKLWMVVGAAMLLAPLVVPRGWAGYLFAPVWLGFVFLLDPWNARRGLPSLVRDLALGRRDRLYSFLAAGWVCGWLWEFWNWCAAARWEYIFPMFQKWKIFAMPAPGYLGFPPFALECFVMYVAAAGLLGWLRPSQADPLDEAPTE
jgi:hypothetical protein